MRVVLLLAWLGLVSAAEAQDAAVLHDPTVPSLKILERLQGEMAPPAAPPGIAEDEPNAMPEFCVKGIVLTDGDHGVAMLECDGRSFAIRLSRESVVPVAQAIPTTARLGGLTIGGRTFYVVDFCEHSILLRTEESTLLVQ